MPAYEHYSDEQLAAAARDEDLDAWEALIRRHGQRVLAYLTRFCGDEALARELWVQCFAELWRLRGSLAAGGRTATALFTQATRLALQQGAVPVTRPVSGDPASLAVRSARLREALLALPARQRAALGLCYFDNLAWDEAARVLGCGAGELKQLCAEGYAAVERHLGPGFLSAGLA
jgi:RNA polymerase sigma-70 factor (ECF subfamily)